MMKSRPLWQSLDRALDCIVRSGAWLVLPVAVLLFLQWPLREVLGRHSREANNLGQWLFALYVAVALFHTPAVLLGFNAFGRLLWAKRIGRLGSGPVHLLTALNVGWMNHTGRLRSDDRCISSSGRPHRQGGGL
jgi:hypothetical protein